MYDVVIVGGSNAGLSAALVLGRMRRHVLVVDNDSPRNAPAPHAHGFFTRDGTPPAELRQIGREQLRRYENVVFTKATATAATQREDGFEIVLDNGARHQTRRLLLASGVRDELPAIPGIAELWGKSVVHCPYCHGWEIRDQPTAIYGQGANIIHRVQMLWSLTHDLVICSNGPALLDPNQRQWLERYGVPVREEPIARLIGGNGMLQQIEFASGEKLPRQAMFIVTVQDQRSDLADQLGCTITAHELNGAPFMRLVDVDASGQTSVPGVYAAGDMTVMGNVMVAAAQGAHAAAQINRVFAAEDMP